MPKAKKQEEEVLGEAVEEVQISGERSEVVEQHRLMVEKAKADQKLANEGKHFGQ